MTSDPRLVWDLKADLGEGPVWVERDAALWFVDIKRQKIYRFDRAKNGAFYCFDRGELKRTHLTGIAITNGPAISPGGHRLYWVDTLAGTISACDIAADGELGSSREIVQIAPTEGHPDGPTVDAKGGIWISLYSGWEARRYSPEGVLLERVRFPVSNITKIAFGGSDLGSAFATTARHLLSADA